MSNRFVGFSDWQASVKATLSDEDMTKECSECSGEGECEDSCECCGQDTITKCVACGGHGFFTYSDTGSLIHPDLTRRAYERAITNDLKKVCAFSSWDFLDMAATFTKECRGIAA